MQIATQSFSHHLVSVIVSLTANVSQVGSELCHASFLGIDLLKFQVSCYSGLDQHDGGVDIVTTRSFQKTITTKHQQNWDGSLTFEKVVRYLPHFKSAIQVPIYVLGIDV